MIYHKQLGLGNVLNKKIYHYIYKQYIKIHFSTKHVNVIVTFVSSQVRL